MKSNNKKFEDSQQVGDIAEYLLMCKLKDRGFTSKKVPGKHSEYDIVATKRDKVYTIEVKYDLKSEQTGNVAIELSKTINGNIEKSGLSITTADIIAYKFPSDDYFYFIQTSKLREIIKTCRDIRRGGDNNSVTLAIYPKAQFKAWCYVFTGKKAKGFKIG